MASAAAVVRRVLFGPSPLQIPDAAAEEEPPAPASPAHAAPRDAEDPPRRASFLLDAASIAAMHATTAPTPVRRRKSSHALAMRGSLVLDRLAHSLQPDPFTPTARHDHTDKEHELKDLLRRAPATGPLVRRLGSDVVASVCSVRTARRGERVRARGDVLVLVSGEVRLSAAWSCPECAGGFVLSDARAELKGQPAQRRGAHRVLVAVAGVGEALGAFEAVRGEPAGMALEALSPVTLARISRRNFVALLRHAGADARADVADVVGAQQEWLEARVAALVRPLHHSECPVARRAAAADAKALAAARAALEDNFIQPVPRMSAQAEVARSRLVQARRPATARPSSTSAFSAARAVPQRPPVAQEAPSFAGVALSAASPPPGPGPAPSPSPPAVQALPLPRASAAVPGSYADSTALGEERLPTGARAFGRPASGSRVRGSVAAAARRRRPAAKDKDKDVGNGKDRPLTAVPLRPRVAPRRPAAREARASTAPAAHRASGESLEAMSPRAARATLFWRSPDQ